MDKVDERFEEAKRKYAVTEEELDDMYIRTRDSIFAGKRPETKHAPIAMVMGGQPGAGKSGLVMKTRQDFRNMGRDVIVLDVDAYRGFFKNAAALAQEYPEYYSDITDVATGYVMKRLLEEATIPNGYNFIFEGTLATPQIIETIRRFGPQYDIRARVIGVSKIESTLSIFERYLEMKKRIGVGRLTTIAAHDKRYDGFTTTALTLEKIGIGVEVFKRNPKLQADPILLYGTGAIGLPHKTVLEALTMARLESHNACLQNAEARLASINEDFQSLDEQTDIQTELAKLNELFDGVLKKTTEGR